jgi:hypothetical protein
MYNNHHFLPNKGDTRRHTLDTADTVNVPGTPDTLDRHITDTQGNQGTPGSMTPRHVARPPLFAPWHQTRVLAETETFRLFYLVADQIQALVSRAQKRGKPGII